MVGFGVRDYHQWIRIEIWSHIQVSLPQIEFSEAISDQITYVFCIFCKVVFLDHPRFRSSQISSNVGSSWAPIHTNGCALES